MKYFVALILLAALSFTACNNKSEPAPLPVPDIEGTETPGKFMGSFSTDNRGNAVYNIPLILPPGTNNWLPELALLYSSSSANGITGIGTSLFGISSISRCRDLRADRPECPETDCAYCMDDVQLLEIRPGEYRTDKESWSRILLSGTAGTSDTSEAISFTVTDKSGVTFEFGTVDNARIYNQGTDDVRQWMLNKAIDRNGNTIVYDYDNQSSAAGEYYPSAISYTGNEQTGLSPQRKIVLGYEDRSDEIESYRYGSEIVFAKRLITLQALILKNDEWVTVRTYSIEYENTGSTLRSRISEVKIHDGDGNYLSPIEFSWQDGTNAVDTEQNLQSFGVENCAFSWADFNGDGRKDLMIDQNQSPFRHYVMLSNGTSLNSPITLTQFGTEKSQYTWTDFDGDGKDDLLVDEHTEGQTSNAHYCFLSTGTGLSSARNLGNFGMWYARFSWIDFNGDGRADLATDVDTLNFDHYILISDGTTLGSAVSLGNLGQSNGTSQWVDFNGDGYSDLVFDQTSNPWNHWLRLSNGNSLENTTDLGRFGTTTSSFTWADINGDGLPDLIRDDISSNAGATQHFAKYSTGVDLAAQLTLGTFGVTDAAYTWLDFNTDGKADLLVDQNSGSVNDRHYLCLSTGSSIEGAITLGTLGGEDVAFSWTDMNGDGMPDLTASKTTSTYTHKVRFHSGDYPDLLTEVQTGLGGSDKVSYAPITDPSLYSSTEVPAYPLQDYLSPRYLVESHSSNDGRENASTYSFTFQYRNSTMDLSGRGWLGFGGIIANDQQTGNVVTTTYLQEFPLTGLTESNQVTNASNQQLNWQTNEYETREEFEDVFIVLHSKNTLSTFDGLGRGYTIQNQFTYDDYGNIILEWDRGDTTSTTNDVYTCTSTINDTANWVLGLPDTARVSNFATINDASRCECDTLFSYNLVQYVDDGTYNVAARLEWDDSNQAWYTESWEYDDYGNPTLYRDQLTGDQITVYEDTYHTFASSITNSLNQKESRTWTPEFGSQLSLIDVNDNTFYTEYDAFGRTVGEYGPDPESETKDTVRLSIISYEESNVGTATARYFVKQQIRKDWDDSDPSNWTIYNFYYDGLARVWRKEVTYDGNAQPILVDYKFDNSARPTGESMPYYPDDSVTWTQMGYDDQSRINTTELPTGDKNQTDRSVSTNTGIGVNKEVVTTAPGTSEETETTSWIDARGDGRTIQYPDGGSSGGAVVDISFDRIRRMDSINRPGDVSSAYRFDMQDRIVEVEDDQLGQTQYNYYLKGQYRYIVDALGDSVFFEYDTLGRMTTRQSNDFLTTFIYDNDQNNSEIENGVGALTRMVYENRETGEAIEYQYSYDAYGNKTAQSMVIDGESYTLGDFFDAQGNRILHMYPDGSVARNWYSAIGFLDSLGIAESESPDDFLVEVRFTDHTAYGNYQRIDYGNGTYATYSYYPGGRLDTVINYAGDSIILGQRYTWNDQAEISSIEDFQDADRSQTMTYWPQGDLKTASASGLYGDLEFDYEISGNLILKDGVTYTSKGQQVVSGVDEDGQEVFAASYNALGQMVTMTNAEGEWTYSYNSEYRLESIQKDGQEVYAFTYDNTGDRVTKFDALSNTLTTYVSFDYEVVRFADTARQVTRYIEGAGGRIVSTTGEAESIAGSLKTDSRPKTRQSRLADTESGGSPGTPPEGTYYYHFDQVQSTSLVTDEDGTVSSRVYYKPFGEICLLEGQDGFRAKFTGKELDANSGLYYYGDRYYNPTIGKFITADPSFIGGTDNTSVIFNRYAYSGNNPFLFNDPTGDIFGLDDAAVAAIVVAISVAVGAYAGGAAVNHNMNPAKWDWKSAKTYLGIAGGAAIGFAGGEIAVGVAGAVGGVTGGIVGGALAGAFESGAYTAMGGGSPGQIAESALTGAAMGAAFAGAAAGASKAVSKARSMFGDIAESAGARMSTRANPVQENVPISAKGCNCFQQGTLVHTSEGLKDISLIQTGDKVYAIGDGNDQKSLFNVVSTISRISEERITLSVAGATVVTTPEHPFYVSGTGWVEAADLKAGDLLEREEGEPVELKQTIRAAAPLRVYNIEVQGAHDYFVTDLGLYVHNPKCTITFNWKKSSGMSKAEFKRQLKWQEKGLNKLSVGKLRDNRKFYKLHGRNKKSASLQKAYRQKHGLTSSQAALHNPDMVAGGRPKPTRGGCRRVNSSLGSQWRSRVKKIDKIILGKARKAKIKFRLKMKTVP